MYIIISTMVSLSKGYRYAGFQTIDECSSQACYCGNFYGRYGNSSACYGTSAGNSSNSTECSGELANIVMDTGISTCQNNIHLNLNLRMQMWYFRCYSSSQSIPFPWIGKTCYPRRLSPTKIHSLPSSWFITLFSIHCLYVHCHILLSFPRVFAITK